MSDEYIQGFIRAEKTFLYQLVFDPQARKLVPLSPYEADITVEELGFAGKYESDKVLICRIKNYFKFFNIN